MKKTSSVVIYSGGMDSFTLLRCLHELGFELIALSFNYGQRHKKELFSAQRVTEQLGITHHVIDLSVLKPLLSGSALTEKNIEVPEGHYAEENMKATVVPNRNMIMLSIATGLAAAKEFEFVHTAVHAGDHDIYPDCRKEFIEKMTAVTEIANYHPVKVVAPFILDSKGEVLRLGQEAAGLTAEHYADTWTCYKGKQKACGRCGSCVERLEAFDSMGWVDPLEYEDREFYKGALNLE